MRSTRAARLAACIVAAVATGAFPHPDASASARQLVPLGGPNTCPYAPVRPTYLPWLAPGESVPPPITTSFTEEGSSYAFLHWRDPAWPDEPSASVAIVRTSEPSLAGPGRPIAVAFQGSDPGQLYDQGKAKGEASIHWVIPNLPSCSTVWLWLNVPGLPRHRAAQEALTVARSLRPAPPTSLRPDAPLLLAFL